MASESTTRTGKSRGRLSVSPLTVLERWGLGIFLLILIVFFALDSTSGGAFRSSGNIKNVLGNQAVTGLIALAMVVPLVCGYFDLSVAAVAGLSNVASAALISHGSPVVIGVVGGIAIGVAAGSINGLLVAGLKLNGFIVTLGTYTLVGGLLQLYTQGVSILTGIPFSVIAWSNKSWLGIPRPFVLLIAACVILWYVLMHTPFGRQLESIGSSERAARLVGIRVDRSVFITFLMSGALAGVAGVLMTSASGGANPNAGPGYLFPALTAVFLGATTIRPGHYNVWGTFVGVYFAAIAINGLSLLGANTWITPTFNGAALVAAVAVSTLVARHRDRRAQASLQADRERAAQPLPSQYSDAAAPAGKEVDTASTQP
jgi:ribose transport system permease protein